MEVGQTIGMLNMKAISLQGAGDRTTATEQDNRLLTTTAIREAMETEMVATAEHVSSATKKGTWLGNVQIQTQDLPKKQWNATSATKKAICPVNAQTNLATTGALNVNGEMTEALTAEMRAG